MSVALDIVLVVVLVAYLVHGWRVGLVRSIGSIVGLGVGGCAAALLAPPIGALAPAGTGRVVATIVTAVVLVIVGYAIGSRIGRTVARLLHRSPLGPVDRVLGAGAQLVVTAFVISILASIALTQHTPYVAGPAAGSSVLHAIAAVTPSPVEHTIHEWSAAAASGQLPAIDLPFPARG